MLLKQALISVFSGFLCSVIMLAGTNCLAVSGPNLQEGLWEITSKMQMMGMNMPAVKHNQCITRENAVPDSSQPNQECKIVETSVNGDTVSWKMVCKTPEGESKINGEITYNGDTFKGTLKIDMQGMEMVQNMSGRRIGDCGN